MDSGSVPFYQNQNNILEVDKFKRILNYYIDFEYREKVIDEVAASLGFTFDASKFYVAANELMSMRDEGMFLGLHSYSHRVMSKLTHSCQETEIRKSLDFFKRLDLQEGLSYCHPYGGEHSFNQSTMELLKKNNIQFAFSVDPRNIKEADFHQSRYRLPRFDCNMFPHGAAS